MPAMSPEEICRLFQRYMAEGAIDSVLSVYDPEAVFLNQSGELKKGEGLKQELAPLVAMKTNFDFSIKQVIQSGDIALMHTEWKVSSPQPMSVYALEVARRQPDGSGAGLSKTLLL
jgi:ketosteroid isomerase-like protein